MQRTIHCFLTIYIYIYDENAVNFTLLKSPEDWRNPDSLKHRKACRDFTVSEVEWFEENFHSENSVAVRSQSITAILTQKAECSLPKYKNKLC